MATKLRIRAVVPMPARLWLMISPGTLTQKALENRWDIWCMGYGSGEYGQYGWFVELYRIGLERNWAH